MTRVGCIGKPSAGADFTVLRRTGAEPPSVEARARDCLQLHIEGGSAVSAYLFAQDGAWWLCRAENEAGSDAAGRPRSRLQYFPLAGSGGARLGALGRACYAPFGDEVEVVEWLARPATAQPTPASRLALVALLLGAEAAAVPTIEEMAAVAEAWGEDRQLLFMAGAERIPWSVRTGGSLLAAPAANWIPLMAVKDLWAGLQDRDIPDASGLRRAGDPGVRQRLLETWAATRCDDFGCWSDDQTTWLLAAGHRRAERIARATPELCRRWLREGRLTPTEAVERRECWNEQDRSALLKICLDSPNGLAAYSGCVADPRPEEVARFLSGTDAAVFAWASAAGGDDPPGGAALRLERLARTGVLSYVTPHAIGLACAALGPQAPMEVWAERMMAAGMPRGVARALIGEPPPSAPPGIDPPALAGAWLAPVPASVLFEQGCWAASDRRWRAWWTDALVHHPAGASLAVLPGPAYSEPAAAWLAGSVHDGEMPEDAGLRVIGRWLSAATPAPGACAVERLFESCCLNDPKLWSAFLEGDCSLTAESPAPGLLADLRRLAAAGIVTLEAVAAAVEAGAAPEWATPLVSRSAAALLGLPGWDVMPSAGPPVGWSNSLNRILSVRVAMPEFWNRWRGAGIGADLSEWLAATLRGEAGGLLAETMLGAHRGTARIPLENLPIVVGAVSRAARTEQACMWADAPSTERRRAFQLLRDGSPAPAVDWLHSRLAFWGFPAMPPAGLACRELAALLPWLDPVWVVQIIMSRHVREVDEDRLLEALGAELRRRGSAPSPPPPPSLAAGRPDWIRTLAELPGWADWAEPQPEEET